MESDKISGPERTFGPCLRCGDREPDFEFTDMDEGGGYYRARATFSCPECGKVLSFPGKIKASLEEARNDAFFKARAEWESSYDAWLFLDDEGWEHFLAAARDVHLSKGGTIDPENPRLEPCPLCHAAPSISVYAAPLGHHLVEARIECCDCDRAIIVPSTTRASLEAARAEVLSNAPSAWLYLDMAATFLDERGWREFSNFTTEILKL